MFNSDGGAGMSFPIRGQRPEKPREGERGQREQEARQRASQRSHWTTHCLLANENVPDEFHSQPETEGLKKSACADFQLGGGTIDLRRRILFSRRARVDRPS
jgi:hypothetical protein